MSSSWQCKRRDCRTGNDITAVQMWHFRKATRICGKPLLSGGADEFGRKTDKQRCVSAALKEKKIMQFMNWIRQFTRFQWPN